MTYSWYKLLFNMTKVKSSKTLVWTSISYCKNNFHPPEYLAMSPFFFNSNHVLKFLDFSYFVILQLLKEIWAKSVLWSQNMGTFKIVPTDFYFIDLKDFRNFKYFSKNSNRHIFLNFEDINFIFCTVIHDNDLIKWCDFCKNQTGVSPVLGCGSSNHDSESQYKDCSLHNP